MLGARLTSAGGALGKRGRRQLKSGRSSGVEHNLAKVGVEGSNPFARSSFLTESALIGELAVAAAADHEAGF